MVQGESEDASLLVILAEPQPIFSKKKYTHDRAQINLSELLEPPYYDIYVKRLYFTYEMGNRLYSKRFPITIG